MDENALSHVIIAAAIEVHRTLGGPGLLENVYEEALAWELMQRGILVERQKALPVRYKGIMLGSPLKIDVIVNNIVIVECKSVIDYKLDLRSTATHIPAINRTAFRFGN